MSLQFTAYEFLDSTGIRVNSKKNWKNLLLDCSPQ